MSATGEREGADVARKWRGEGAAVHYAGPRFRSSRAAARDPALVARLFAQHGVPAGARVLDAPCGTGRLAGVLPGCVALDANLPMARHAGAREQVRSALCGSVLALPFRTGAFDAVVCCRLLHHLLAEAELARAVEELARVSRGFVFASFWDAGSLPAVRVRLGLKRGEGPRGRRAVPRAHVARLFEAAGMQVLGFRSTLRFVSQQTFVAARHRPRS